MPALPIHFHNFCVAEDIHPETEKCKEYANHDPNDVVAAVYNLLQAKGQFNIFEKRDLKNEREARDTMAAGYTAFNAKDDIASINRQTVALSLAPPQSAQFYMPYAYRSASLFRLERFRTCLIDVNRALKGGEHIPPKIRANLLERKEICVDMLKHEQLSEYNKKQVMSQLAPAPAVKEDKSKKESAEKQEDDKSGAEQPTMSRSQKKKLKKKKKFRARKEKEMAGEVDEDMSDPNYEYRFCLPAIENPNETMPCASAKVNIAYSEEYGRHLIATDDIKPGELLIAERAFASTLFPHHYTVICRYCYVRCEILIPCPKCLVGTYCSESCRSKAFDEFHRVECSMLHSMMLVQVIGTTHLALRLLLIATKQGANLSSLMQHPTYGSPMNIYSGPIEGQYLSDDYKSIHNHLHHYQDIPPFVIFRKSYEAANVLHLLRHTTFFGRAEDDDSELANELSEAEIFTGALLLKFILTSMCNSHTIKDDVEMPKANSDTDDLYNSGLLGCGLYPVYSLMNHSCDPNAWSVNFKDSVACYALQPIKKGEQIFTHYHWTYDRYDKGYRTNLLKLDYFINCQCKACTLNWKMKPAYLGVPPRRIAIAVSEKEIKSYERKFKMFVLRDGVQDPTQEDLDFLIEMISFYHRYVKQPNCTYLGALECFWFLLEKRGNFYDFEDEYVVSRLSNFKGYQKKEAGGSVMNV